MTRESYFRDDGMYNDYYTPTCTMATTTTTNNIKLSNYRALYSYFIPFFMYQKDVMTSRVIHQSILYVGMTKRNGLI
jgi:hypothetical protein